MSDDYEVTRGGEAPPPAPAAPERLDAPTSDAFRARQQARARVMAVLLGLFVILIFAISIAKIQLGYGE